VAVGDDVVGVVPAPVEASGADDCDPAPPPAVADEGAVGDATAPCGAPATVPAVGAGAGAGGAEVVAGEPADVATGPAVGVATDPAVGAGAGPAGCSTPAPAVD
jgi:hypothetical protein